MMLFNDALTMRFNTLKRNIKAKSNSFYDSYHDLLEATLKFMLDENNVPYDDTRTCGHIVRTEEARGFFINILKLDDYTFSKIPDYIKKCNDHKHKKEKTLMVEGVVNFMKYYFTLVNHYSDFIQGEKITFSDEYFKSIFGETERLNKEYRDMVSKMKDELQNLYESKRLSELDIEKYKNLVAVKDLELLSLDEQNKLLQEQINILKDIKLSSMEDKLNKTIDMLNNLQDYLVENRAATSIVVKLINGRTLTEEDIKAERAKMEAKKNER